MKSIKIFHSSLLILILIFISGCEKKGGNPVFNYLTNSDLKFDNKIQRDNIMQACKDILMYAPDDLKQKRYKDYDGNEDQWDLQTLFAKHFVPKKQGLSWGDDFYHDVKQDSVKSFVSHILVTY
jgi:hypothetical protein